LNSINYRQNIQLKS